MGSLKRDLLGCLRAEAIRVESQRVLKVRVHPPHDVGAKLPGRSSACLCFQGLAPSLLPRPLQPLRAEQTPYSTHPSPTHLAKGRILLVPGKSLKGRKGTAQYADDDQQGMLQRPMFGLTCWGATIIPN